MTGREKAQLAEVALTPLIYFHARPVGIDPQGGQTYCGLNLDEAYWHNTLPGGKYCPVCYPDRKGKGPGDP